MRLPVDESIRGLLVALVALLFTLIGYGLGVPDGRGQMQREAVERNYGMFIDDAWVWRESVFNPVTRQRIMAFWWSDK